jgi:hypothetical protein
MTAAERNYRNVRARLLNELDRTARAVGDVDRFDADGFGQVAIDRMHVVEDRLESAIDDYLEALTKLAGFTRPDESEVGPTAFTVADGTVIAAAVTR